MFGRRIARTEADGDRRCSFCGRSEHDVRRLIAGPTVFICDECVSLCVRILADDPRAAPRPEDEADGVGAGARWPAAEASCALCWGVVEQATALLIENRTLLCDSCVQAISAVANEAKPRAE